jgi:hypothetical protein
MTTANRVVGQRVYFAREGDAFTVPSAGTVGRSSKPGDADAAWVEFGDVDEFGITPEHSMKEVWSPGSGAILELKDAIPNKPKTTVEFRTQELSPAAYEMLFRTAKLDNTATTHTPHAKTQKKGVLRIVQKADDMTDPVNTIYLYGILEVSGKVDFGEDYVRVPFRFTMLTSSLNAGTLDA